MLILIGSTESTLDRLHSDTQAFLLQSANITWGPPKFWTLLSLTCMLPKLPGRQDVITWVWLLLLYCGWMSWHLSPMKDTGSGQEQLEQTHLQFHLSRDCLDINCSQLDPLITTFTKREKTLQVSFKHIVGSDKCQQIHWYKRNAASILKRLWVVRTEPWLEICFQPNLKTSKTSDQNQAFKDFWRS